MKYLLFGIILCLLSACAFTEKTTDNTSDAMITRSESAIIIYDHPSVCEDCIYIKPETDPGTCKHCGNITDSKSYKYCTDCSKRYYACARCLGPLDEDAYLNDILFSMKLKEGPQEKKLKKIKSPIKRLPGFCSRHQSGTGTCDMSNCIYCGASVSSGSFKLCTSCAISFQRCRKCLGNLNN